MPSLPHLCNRRLVSQIFVHQCKKSLDCWRGCRAEKERCYVCTCERKTERGTVCSKTKSRTERSETGSVHAVAALRATEPERGEQSIPWGYSLPRVGHRCEESDAVCVRARPGPRRCLAIAASAAPCRHRALLRSCFPSFRCRSFCHRPAERNKLLRR